MPWPHKGWRRLLRLRLSGAVYPAEELELDDVETFLDMSETRDELSEDDVDAERLILTEC
jgi:hypothetical protein